MRCLNCGRTIPDSAKSCEFCESPVTEEPPAEVKDAIREMLKEMPPEALDELRTAFEECKTGEDFVNRIMTGPCPHCGSLETGDCDDDPEISNILVGRCYKCGQMWCTECGRLLERASPVCECWP